MKWRPPLDPAPVLAAHSKVTVLLMNAVEKQAHDANVICDDSSDEDREWIMDKRSARWWDIKDALEELAELVDRRSLGSAAGD